MTGPALKVLSVEDGKIPTKKVKVQGKFLCDTFAFTFLVGILPSSTPVKKTTLYILRQILDDQKNRNIRVTHGLAHDAPIPRELLDHEI